jgi:hypothetical protein
MVTFADVQAARNHSNFQEVVLDYLEPSNLYQVLEDEHQKIREAEDLADDVPPPAPVTTE